MYTQTGPSTTNISLLFPSSHSLHLNRERIPPLLAMYGRWWSVNYHFFVRQSILIDPGSTFLPAFGGVTIFYFGHSDRCTVVFHLFLIWIFRMANNIEQLFMCLFASVYLLCWTVSSGVLLIFKWGCLLSYCQILRVLKNMLLILVFCWICGLQILSPTR